MGTNPYFDTNVLNKWLLYKHNRWFLFNDIKWLADWMGWIF